jgi:hypothetical protein
MYVSVLPLLLGAYGVVHALTVPGTSPWFDKHLTAPLSVAKRSEAGEVSARALCPLAWTAIGLELKLSFLGLGGCNNLARYESRPNLGLAPVVMI